jgi:hypothetical protein
MAEKGWGMAQVVEQVPGSEFKLQYHKKKSKRRKQYLDPYCRSPSLSSASFQLCDPGRHAKSL